MSIRNLTLAVGVCLAAAVAFGQPGAGYLFQLPGPGSSNAQIVGYPYAASPLTPSVTTLGPNGTYQIVAKPDGSGYYVLGATLQIANPSFTTFTSVNGIANTPTAVATSPDGNFVIVGAGNVYVLAASSNQILLNTTTNGTVVGIAVSRDSKFAYVLSNGPGASYVTLINLQTHTASSASPLQLTGNATSISFSPLNLLYVTATNRVFEIDPVAFQLTTNGTMTPNATPGPLRYTADGTTAYFVNQTSNVTGGAILQITLATHFIASWPPSNGSSPTPLDDVFVAGNGRIFAVSYSTQTLFDVSVSPLGLALSSLNTIFNAQSILGVAISNELPSALYLYALVATNGQNNIYRINLSTNQISTQVGASLSGGTMQFVGVPPQTGAGSFIQFNDNQTVAQGKTSLPLIARVLDLTGRPIFNMPVNFTTDPASGVVLNTPSPTTNADGYVQTTVTAPAVQGTYTITLTAGTANTTFTMNVPGAGGSTGGGGTGGVTQVSIVTGDGQLVQAGFTTNLGGTGDDLTVLITDVNGVPLPGVSVDFEVTSGTGNIATAFGGEGTGSTTDSKGLARSAFHAGIPANGTAFETDTVVATTPYGSVNFTEISFASNIVGTLRGADPPTITLLTPTIDTSRTVTVSQGGVASNAVTAQIFAGSVPYNNCPNVGQGTSCPIPGVSIRIVDPNNSPAQSPYASCKGSTLSDQTGTAHCNVVATCGSGLGVFPVAFLIGDDVAYSGNVVVTQGSGQSLSIVSGNKQNGSAGQSLQFPLVATVTDGCGGPVTGAQVTWKITQGSATLTNTVGTSGSSGHVTTNLTFGPAPGPVQVTATLGTAGVVTFTLTNNVVISSMNIVSGNNQTATVNTAFALPLTVQIKDAANNNVSGATVTFAVTSGNATVNPTTAVTDSQGRASTTATASQSAGLIVVTASYASVSAPFSLTAVPQGPVLTAASFQNAASFVTGLVPCGLGVATGPGLAPGIIGTVSGASFFGPLPYVLNGLSLSIGGVPAPIYQLSNTNGKQQVTFQTPCEVVPTSNATAVIQNSGASTTVTGVLILQAQPGIFFYTGSNGKAYGQVISADDGTYITALNPAKRGHNYYLVATGLGQVTPPTATDAVGVNGQTVANSVIVGVSNLGVPVFAQFYQPGEVGIYIIGFTIPLTNPAGPDQPLALAINAGGNTIFGNAVFLPLVQ
jgi:uncharacterized protein (TIGR03437 family)